MIEMMKKLSILKMFIKKFYNYENNKNNDAKNYQ